MKIKIGLLLGVISFSAVISGVAWFESKYSHSTLPGGTYQASCRNITMKTVGSGSAISRLITADCEDINNNLKKTSIKLPVFNNEYLDFTLENENGKLKSFQPQLMR